MPRFRISSQQSSRGNKLLGGLRSYNIGTSSANTRSQSRRAYGRNARRIVSSSSYSNYTFLHENTYSVSWQTTPPIPAWVNLPSSIVATGTSASSNYQLQYESVQGDNATQTYMQWYDDNMYYQAPGSFPTVPGPIMKFQLNNDNTYNVMYNITSSWISGTLTPSQSSTN